MASDDFSTFQHSPADQIPTSSGYRRTPPSNASPNRTPFYLAMVASPLFFLILGALLQPYADLLWIGILTVVMIAIMATVAFVMPLAPVPKLIALASLEGVGLLAVLVIAYIGYMPLSGWVTFESEQGDFTVLMPGSPTSTGDARGGFSRQEYDDQPKQYRVATVDLTEEMLKDVTGAFASQDQFVSKLTQAFPDDGPITLDLTLDSDQVTSKELIQKDALCHRVTARDGETVQIADVRLLGNRLYLNAIKGPGLTPSSPQAEKFLNSFTLIRKTGPSSPSPSRSRPVVRGGIVEPPPGNAIPGSILYLSFDGNVGSARVTAPKFEPSQVLGQALRVDGPDQIVDLGDDPGLNIEDGATFTIAFWVKPKSKTGTLLSMTSSTDSMTRLEVVLKNGRPYASMVADGQTSAPGTPIEGATIDDGQWHHITVLRDKKKDLATGNEIHNFEMFVDGGRALGSQSVSGSLTTDQRFLGTDGFVGLLDEFGAWNRKLKEYSELGPLAGRGK